MISLTDNGAVYFLIWPFIWEQILIGSTMLWPTLQGRIWMFAEREIPRAKRTFPGPAALGLFLPPPPPPRVLRQWFASPSASLQHALGWIPFLVNVQLHSTKSSPRVRAFLFCSLLKAQCSATAGTWWSIRVFSMAVGKSSSLSCWIHLNKRRCLSFWVPKVAVWLNCIPSIVNRRREKSNFRRQYMLQIRWDGPEFSWLLFPSLKWKSSLLHRKDKLKWGRE